MNARPRPQPEILSVTAIYGDPEPTISATGPACLLTQDQTLADMAQMLLECFGPVACAALAHTLAATIEREGL